MKIPTYYRYIATQEFEKLTAGNFGERLKQAKLATKDDIADFVKKTYFDEKLININKKVTSNKARHLEAGKNKMIHQKKSNYHL